MSDMPNRYVDLLALRQDNRMEKTGTLSPNALHRPNIFSPMRKFTNSTPHTKVMGSVLLFSLALCIIALLVFNNAWLFALHTSKNTYRTWSLTDSSNGYPGGGYPGNPGGGYPGGGYPGGGYPGGGYPGNPGGGYPGNPGGSDNSGSGSYLTPQDLWRLYNLPGTNGGKGQTIGEVIDGGLPTVESDLDAYSQRFGLPSCTRANGCLSIKYQGGHPIAPSNDQMEGLLDIEIMHAVAPKAHILVYMTKASADDLARGPAALIKTPGLKAINMSYGYDGNGKAYESIYKNNPYHVALVAASGDDGHATLTPPGIYPEVIAVGGTVVQGSTERAWNSSGGGQTSAYAEPAYQKTYGLPRANGHRGVPDVAAVAGSPIGIFDQGQFHGVEGTSEAAPIWTGIAALIKKPLSNELLYSLAKRKPDSFNDITSGTNGQCGFVCTAHSGYDYITGLGTPRHFVANVNAMN